MTSAGRLCLRRATLSDVPVLERFADPALIAIVIDPLATNTRAIAFYHRLGYVTVEHRRFGDDDCLVLRLTREAWREG